MPFSSLRPRNSEAQRCGQRWSMTPTRPELSRKAINCSPSSRRRIGAPSRGSSDDIAAGCQYCRINLPMTVPGPTRTKSSLSLRFIELILSRPEGEAEAGAGAGRGAITGLVQRPFQRQVLDRAGDADPVADLGAAGVELLARQSLDARAVLAPHHVDEAAVERLVDDEMRQPARADDADPLVAGIAFDGGADRLAELVAARRGRLVWRVVGVDADRHDWHDFLHDPLVDKADCVPLALALGCRIGGRDVELAVDQLVDQMARQLRIDRIVARLLFLIPARRRSPAPI